MILIRLIKGRALLWVLFLSLSLLGARSFASSSDRDQCMQHLRRGPQRGVLIPSGRDADVFPKFEEVASLLFGPGKVLDTLGLHAGLPILEFTQGTELDSMAGLGRPPIPHWHDGAAILRTLTAPNLIYEFVTPGCQYSHSYFRDTASVGVNISILFHVIGHYHYNRHSKFRQVREVDMPTEALELFRLMEGLYREVGHDEVSLWYQYLLSLQYAQDVSRGTHKTIEEILAPREKGVRFAPTASVLQAFVANLPRDIPEWKRAMALQFERMNRFISGAIPTKIMNEGWASLMQELLTAHMPTTSTFPHALEHAELMAGVTRPSLENPYFLGREAWRNLRRAFNERPEIQGLTQLERDARFIAYATSEFIEGGDDFDNLRRLLDPQWIREHNLVLSKEHNWWEIQGMPAPPPPPPGKFKNPTIKVVVSRDPEVVAHAIASRVADLRYKIPRTVMIDPNFQGSGMTLLGFEDEAGLSVALDQESVALTLAVYAQILDRPVAIDTLALDSWPDLMGKSVRPKGSRVVLSPWVWPPRQPKPVTPVPIRISVSPNGKAMAWSLEGDKKEPVGLDPLSDRLTTLVGEFNEDNFDSLSPELQVRLGDRFGSRVEGVVAGLTGMVPVGFYTHAPTAARAILEYRELAKRRLANALANAMSGKGPMKRTGTGIRVRVLPVVPFFQFDEEALESLANPASVDSNVLALMQMAVDIDQHDGKEGDPFWGERKPPKKPGNDDGDENGDGEPGDKPGGKEAGQGSIDPSFMDISLDEYAALLEDYIDLPRQKPKGGKSRVKETTLGGATQRRGGRSVYPLIGKEAWELGIASRLSEGTEDAPVDLMDDPAAIFLSGLGQIRGSNWWVMDDERVRDPELNAIVTVCLDTSGSMMGWYIQSAKKAIFDLRAILMRKYKNIQFRFISFDSGVTVYDDFDKFIREVRGGGTDYSAGLDEVFKVHEDFPRNRWDRYVLGFGDLGDFGTPEQVMGRIRRLVDETEYVGMVGVGEWARESPLGQAFAAHAQTEEWFGFENIDGPDSYSPSLFRGLFKNKPK